MNAPIDPTPRPVAVGDIYRSNVEPHDLFEVVACDVTLSLNSGWPPNGELLIIYRNSEKGVVFARPRAEFEALLRASQGASPTVAFVGHRDESARALRIRSAFTDDAEAVILALSGKDERHVAAVRRGVSNRLEVHEGLVMRFARRGVTAEFSLVASQGDVCIWTARLIEEAPVASAASV